MNQLLVIHVPGEISDDIIDALIAHEETSGFSLTEIKGYSREHGQYNLEEQVAGCRRLYRFEVQHRAEQEHALLELLAGVCMASHARYWIIPLNQTGTLGSGKPLKITENVPP
ncbi:MAG: hypothetical protein CME59_13595 [Halioglobus sp.]|mgnify:CR=1 FL=1|nr:hypothetical protein [Halioglobus sp.]|tara:strand:+ start:8240 stop:8578 length:339 start_codon:yes stop_codon:yes gene_type:complete